MVRAAHSVEIGRPAEQVFAYATALEHWPEWALRVLSVRQTPAGPLREGVTLAITNRLLGRTVETPYTVTAYEPNRRLAFRSTAGPVPAEFTFSFAPADGGTRVTEVVEMAPRGVLRLAGPLLKSLSERQFAANHRALKERLEASV
jgi:uncharacterized membrane protein